MPEGLEEGTRFRVGHDLLVDLAGNALHDDLREHHALAHAFAHQSYRLVQVGWESAKARQPVLVVLERFEAQRVGEFVGGLNAAALIERCQVPVILMAFDCDLVIFPEKVVVQLVARRKAAAVDHLEPRQHSGPVLVVLLDCFEA